MNALVVPNVAQLPAHLTSRIGAPSALGAAVSAGIHTGGGSSFKRISIRGGRFRVRDGSNETILPDSVLRAVIVGASPNVTKSFYKGAYNPKAVGEEKKPDCFSNDGIRPSNNSADIQSQLCATCPQNAWGSKITDAGTKMKACADQKRLAVISADDTSDDPEVYLFQVTPAALKQFGQYGEALASKGYSPEICVTEIYFDPKEAYPKAQFKFGGFVSQEQVNVIDNLIDSELVREIIGSKDEVAAVVEEPKPSPVKAKAAPAYTPPPPVVEDAVFEEAPPPPAKPTKGFGATAAPSAPREPAPATTVQSSNLTKDIQSILDGMTDEDE